VSRLFAYLSLTKFRARPPRCAPASSFDEDKSPKPAQRDCIIDLVNFLPLNLISCSHSAVSECNPRINQIQAPLTGALMPVCCWVSPSNHYPLAPPERIPKGKVGALLDEPGVKGLTTLSLDDHLGIWRRKALGIAAIERNPVLLSSHDFYDLQPSS
jgi:hypothetical protein